MDLLHALRRVQARVEELETRVVALEHGRISPTEQAEVDSYFDVEAAQQFPSPREIEAAFSEDEATGGENEYPDEPAPRPIAPGSVTTYDAAADGEEPEKGRRGRALRLEGDDA